MADVMQGKFCGECHGKVAFPPASACERCHQALPQPPDRAQPVLLGTLTLVRPVRSPESVLDSSLVVVESPLDSTVEATEVAEAAPAIDPQRAFVTTSLPNAIFPHWVHRVRFQCRVCHMDLFEPRLGANQITMAAIDEGRFCGSCHDGKTAFDVSFDSCQRCHQSPGDGD